jgi:hypothetical protein
VIEENPVRLLRAAHECLIGKKGRFNLEWRAKKDQPLPRGCDATIKILRGLVVCALPYVAPTGQNNPKDHLRFYFAVVLD